MRAYSLDLRQRIVDAVDRQVGSQGAVATLFGVSRTLVKKLLRQRRETGTVAPKPHGGGHEPKVTEVQRRAVRDYILRTQNDATLAEVQRYLRTKRKVRVSRATVGRIVQKLELPRKKNARGVRAG
jgi:transposase